MAKPVLVVGASGKLGTKIVNELLSRGARVRVTHRAHTPLEVAGAESVVADLGDAASLARACEGVGVVVSAVQGLGEIIVDGQTRLLRAAEAAGVARMIPSDYSLDFFKTQPGGNRNLDLRRDFNRVLDGSRVRGSSVLNGAFMDLVAMGRIGPDPQTGAFRVFGDPDQVYDFTHTDDVARYIAAVALDDSAGRMVRVSGDSLSPRQLAAVFTDVRGLAVAIQPAGSVADLDRMIDGMRAADTDATNPFPTWQQLQYIRDMARGDGRLAPLDNARYPEIVPRTVRQLLATAPPFTAI